MTVQKAASSLLLDAVSIVLLRQLLFALGLQATVATELLGLGGWLVIQGQLTLGQLVAAELIVTAIVGSFVKMGKHLESFYDLLASICGNCEPIPCCEHLAISRSVDIFHGTIDENVHLNRPHPSALGRGEAPAAVGLVDVSLQLPDGLNTMLQTHDAPLSTAQALRLTLARALVGRPRLLLIDGTLDALSDDMQHAL